MLLIEHTVKCNIAFNKGTVDDNVSIGVIFFLKVPGKVTLL